MPVNINRNVPLFIPAKIRKIPDAKNTVAIVRDRNFFANQSGSFLSLIVCFPI